MEFVRFRRSLAELKVEPKAEAALKALGSTRTAKSCLQTGQRIARPPASCGTCKAVLQCGQRVTWDIVLPHESEPPTLVAEVNGNSPH